jgi:hypothetical protein
MLVLVASLLNERHIQHTSQPREHTSGTLQRVFSFILFKNHFPYIITVSRCSVPLSATSSSPEHFWPQPPTQPTPSNSSITAPTQHGSGSSAQKAQICTSLLHHPPRLPLPSQNNQNSSASAVTKTESWFHPPAAPSSTPCTTPKLSAAACL